MVISPRASPAPRPALGHIPLTELKRGAASDLLVDLGQLAAYRDAHIWHERRQNGEAARQARRGLEGDHQAAAAAPALELRLQIAGSARKIADEAKAVSLVAGGHERREHRRRARQHGEAQRLGGSARDQALTRVGDARHARVAHQRHVLPFAQQTHDLLGLLHLVVPKQAGERGVDVEVAEQLARMPRILGGDQVGGA